MLKILKWNRKNTEMFRKKKQKNSIVLIFAIKNTPPHVIFGNSTDAMTQKY